MSGGLLAPRALGPAAPAAPDPLFVAFWAPCSLDRVGARDVRAWGRAEFQFAREREWKMRVLALGRTRPLAPRCPSTPVGLTVALKETGARGRVAVGHPVAVTEPPCHF